MLVLSSLLCSPHKVCLLGMHLLWKGKLLQTVPQNNSSLPHVPPLGTVPSIEPPPCPCCAPALPGQVGDMVISIFRYHRGGSHPKSDAPFPTSLCPSVTSHGGTGWCHLSWPNPAGFGVSRVQSTPAKQAGPPLASCPQGQHTCPEMAPRAHPKLLRELSHLGQGALDHGGDTMGDIEVTLAAGSHDVQGASLESSRLSDSRGNIPNAVSHIRNNS